jgi:hypothetical protein
MKHNTNQFVRDAAAYLRFSARTNQKPEVTLFNLAHDIIGIANDEPCFLPRVTGYEKSEQENHGS